MYLNIYNSPFIGLNLPSFLNLINIENFSRYLGIDIQSPSESEFRSLINQWRYKTADMDLLSELNRAELIIVSLRTKIEGQMRVIDSLEQQRDKAESIVKSLKNENLEAIKAIAESLGKISIGVDGLQEGQIQLLEGQQGLREDHRLILSEIKNFNQKVEEIKKSFTEPEKIIEQIEELIENFYKEMKPDVHEDCRKRLKGTFMQWSKMEENSRLFLITAEVVFEKQKDVSEKIDFAPIVLGYCKALELELVTKIFKMFKTHLRNQFGRGLAGRVTGDRNYRKEFVEYVLDNRDDKKLTLGNIGRILKEMGRTSLIQRSFVLNEFKKFLNSQFLNQSNFFINPNQLPKVLDDIRVKCRNGATHTEPLSKEMLNKCKACIANTLNNLSSKFR